MNTDEKGIPTFDDWFKARNAGMSFEQVHQYEGAWIATSMKRLSLEMRDYVSEMVRSVQEEKQ